MNRNCMAIDHIFWEFVVVSSVFFWAILRMAVAIVFVFHVAHVRNMGTKHGIKKGTSRISKTERIKGPAHQNCYERKG